MDLQYKLLSVKLILQPQEAFAKETTTQWINNERNCQF